MARDSPQLIHFFRDNKILSNSADTIYCRRAQGEGGGGSLSMSITQWYENPMGVGDV